MSLRISRKIKLIAPIILLLLLACMIYSLSLVKELNVVYPFDGTLFPYDIAAPTIVWDDLSEAETWNITIEFQDTEKPITAEMSVKTWAPDRNQWETIKERSLEKTAECTIKGYKEIIGFKRKVSHKSFSITTSRDKVDAPIFFRSVTLPFEYAVNNVETIKWCLGDIASYEKPRIVLENLPVCGNCHSFSNDGKYLGMDIDYANDKGSYIVAEITEKIPLTAKNVITWSDYRRDEKEPTFGLLSQVSPDGRYTVSTVKDRSVFVPVEDFYYSQLFFPLKGILVYYDLETGNFHELPGADDKRYVQSNPSWSPDGKRIVFARHEVGELKKVGNSVLLTRQQCEKYLTGGEKFKFDLYGIPFNEGKGGIAEPLKGASQNGMSNYFAKYSPDGKWIVFCKAESFMLLQPDSKLYIMPAEGGEPREMTCNTHEMNSWHSWSPNGRWMVFSSKAFSPYTQLFLTHIDENGMDSPPVLLSRFTAPERAANIPEFVNISYDDLVALDEQFIDEQSYANKAGQLFDQGRFAEAEKFLRKSIELNPDYPIAHKNLGYVLTKLNRIDEAEKEWKKAITLEKDDPRIYLNLGSIYLGRNDHDQARDMFSKTIEIDPVCTPAFIGLGIVSLLRNDLDAAEKKFQEAVDIDPNYDDAHYRLGIVFMKKEEFDKAEKAFKKALDLNNKNGNAYLGLAQILARDQNTVSEAITLYTKGMDILSSNPHDHIAQGNIYLQQGNRERAMQEFEQLMKINPNSQSLRMYVNQLKRQKLPN